MRIAIFGSTSQIAKDLIEFFSLKKDYECVLFGRSEASIKSAFDFIELPDSYKALDYLKFSVDEGYDVIINFVGVGNPTVAKAMGASIFDITAKYDDLALNYLQHHPATKYIFLSSGAVYGGNYEEPVTDQTCSTIDINNFKESSWYSMAKLYAEAKHRANAKFSIIDIRVFNYFSHNMDLSARFLITDIVRAIKSGETLVTSPENIVRDYLSPMDFCSLVESVLKTKEINTAVDAYTCKPVDKLSLLQVLSAQFGLKFEMDSSYLAINATGNKPSYYSENKIAQSLGYVPKYTSMEGIITEIGKLTKGVNAL